MFLKGFHFHFHRGSDLKSFGWVLEAFLKLVQGTDVVTHISFHFVRVDSCKWASHPLMLLALKLSCHLIQPQIREQAVLNSLALWVLRDRPVKCLLFLVKVSDLMDKRVYEFDCADAMMRAVIFRGTLKLFDKSSWQIYIQNIHFVCTCVNRFRLEHFRKTRTSGFHFISEWLVFSEWAYIVVYVQVLVNKKRICLKWAVFFLYIYLGVFIQHFYAISQKRV